MQIIINVYGINYDKKVWGKPEEWDPQHVLEDAALDMGFKDFRMLPFGAGKRICAGVSQALVIISMIMAHLVQHFQWELPLEELEKTSNDTKSFTNHKLHSLQAVACTRHSARLQG